MHKENKKVFKTLQELVKELTTEEKKELINIIVCSDYELFKKEEYK